MDGIQWISLESSMKEDRQKASIVQQAKYPHLEWIDLLHSDAWAGWTETPLSSCLSPLIILQDYEIVLFIFTLGHSYSSHAGGVNNESLFSFTCILNAWPLELSVVFSCCNAWHSCCYARLHLRVSVCPQRGGGDWREDGASGGRYDPWRCICYL